HKDAPVGWNDISFWAVGHVTLLSLPAGGPPEVLLDPPDQVRGVDIARDLIDANRFGGPAPRPGRLPVRPLAVVLATVALLAVVSPSAGLAWWLRRRRRHPVRPHPG
ncbi:MAG TPA: hypothetical protein VF755_30020, partial [Catenuloplanes sp.]